MSMDKGHNGRYMYTTIHRQFTIKSVLRAMVILWEKKMTTYMKYGRNKGPVQGIHTNGFSTLVGPFWKITIFRRG